MVILVTFLHSVFLAALVRLFYVQTPSQCFWRALKPLVRGSSPDLPGVEERGSPTCHETPGRALGAPLPAVAWWSEESALLGGSWGCAGAWRRNRSTAWEQLSLLWWVWGWASSPSDEASGWSGLEAAGGGGTWQGLSAAFAPPWHKSWRNRGGDEVVPSVPWLPVLCVVAAD